uniref:ATP synthase complex subunit 8 n=2 Tax=Dicronychus TaxID=942001 RepID=A0A343C2X4_9COLE|nr:ATP synthase F0 subunit 8 [Dicronychus sp. DIC01]ARH54367.1 ATP synthase F0 subunit 8 [Dicronychus cinereus]
MPQMAPLSWINLFIFFSSTFILLNTLNYFAFSYQLHKSDKKMSTKKINWKW